jgi:hypothetical protein
MMHHITIATNIKDTQSQEHFMTPWVENISFIVFKSKLLQTLPKHPKIINLLACRNMKTKIKELEK